METITYRRPQLEDLQRVAEIYNHAVRETAATFDTEEKAPGYFAAFVPGDQLHRMLVAVVVAGQDEQQEQVVVGYTGIYPFSQRKAYAQMAEAMLYVHPAWQRRGVGRGLLAQMHRGGFLDGLYNVLALVNRDSVHVQREFARLGYVPKGEMSDVAVKFGRRHSLAIYQGLVSSTCTNHKLSSGVLANSEEEYVKTEIEHLMA